MSTIRAYVRYDEYTNTHYYQDFEIIEDYELPKVGDIIKEYTPHAEAERWLVEDIISISPDVENSSSVFEYAYYEVCLEKKEQFEEDEKEYTESYCKYYAVKQVYEDYYINYGNGLDNYAQDLEEAMEIADEAADDVENITIHKMRDDEIVATVATRKWHAGMDGIKDYESPLLIEGEDGYFEDWVIKEEE